MNHKSEWIAYLAGAILTLAYKYFRYLYTSRKSGVPARQATLEWFLEPSRDNAVSWAVTIGAVWLCGSLYIDKAMNITGLSELPVLDSMAFLLGAMMETTAPAVAKWLASKLPNPPQV
jgi:hypothetical protein